MSLQDCILHIGNLRNDDSKPKTVPFDLSSLLLYQWSQSCYTEAYFYGTCPFHAPSLLDNFVEKLLDCKNRLKTTNLNSCCKMKDAFDPPFIAKNRKNDGWRYHLSKRHRNNALSTEAQALDIWGKTPQKQTVWHALYRCITMAGILLMIGVFGFKREGHCTQTPDFRFENINNILYVARNSSSLGTVGLIMWC